MSKDLERRIAAMEVQRQASATSDEDFWADTFSSRKPGWDVSGFPGRTLGEKIVAAACAYRWKEESPVPAHLWAAAREWFADMERLDDVI